jgi:hypothetical protein
MRAILAVALLACIAPSALAANTITGVVRNQSRDQAAASDEVILIRIDGQLHEEGHTKTDQQGMFSLNVQYPDKPYLVRVFHQNVNYDQPAMVGGALSIRVFDASPHVAAVTSTIEILRVGTKGKSLHVSDMYEIVNSSNPPLTQAGDRTFDVYLPANARIDSVLAAGPEKIGSMISATRVPDEPGHYFLNFPLRPGATKFAFNYDLPYDGHAAFRTRHTYPLRQFAVMIPPDMKFTSSSPDFGTLAADSSKYQVRAANQLKAGEGPAFEVSGTGVLPTIGGQPVTEARARPSGIPSATSGMNPGPSSLSQVSPKQTSPQHISPQSARTSSSVPLLTWTGINCVLLAAGALIVLRIRRSKIQRSKIRISKTVVVAPGHNDGNIHASTALLQGLHLELSQLETDRREGAISAEEYASVKQAMDQTIKRALARAPVAR